MFTKIIYFQMTDMNIDYEHTISHMFSTWTLSEFNSINLRNPSKLMIFQVFCIKNHLIIIKYLIESLKYLSKLERVVLGGSKTFSSVNFESELMILELLKAGSSSSQELDDPAQYEKRN